MLAAKALDTIKQHKADQPNGQSGNNQGNDAAPTRTLWADALRRLLKNKMAVVAFFWIVFIVLVALSADLWVPYLLGSPTDIDTTLAAQNSKLPPSALHPFGTDNLGRDVMARVIYGARVSLSVGVIAVAISTTIGIVLGSLAAYFGGIGILHHASGTGRLHGVYTSSSSSQCWHAWSDSLTSSLQSGSFG